MSLYDDIDTNKESSKPDISGWGSGFKLLQSQLKAKKASLVQAKKQKSSTSVAPVVDLRKVADQGEELYFNPLTGKREPRSNGSSGSPFISHHGGPSLFDIEDEYDPNLPNDYETVVKRLKREREAERRRKNDARERDSRRKRRHSGGSNNSGDNNSDGEGDSRHHKSSRGSNRSPRSGNRSPRRGGGGDRSDDDDDRRTSGAAIAPPTALIEQDKQMLETPMMKSTSTTKIPFAGSTPKILAMMEKMGYKEGAGLGKSEQGMSTALIVEKTSKRGGRIIHEKDTLMNAMPPPLPAKVEPQVRSFEVPNTADLLRNPSKVIVLRNMVSPGDVDDELEEETAEECQKYGKVVKCVIFEMPNETEDESVRIFVEFEKQEAAIKSVIDLNGRYFGGRVVKVNFYDIDKFRDLKLSESIT